MIMFCSSITEKKKNSTSLKFAKDSEAKEKKKEMGTNISLYTITWEELT